jgi:L-2-hydroxyglutarate oxidase LhgO
METVVTGPKDMDCLVIGGGVIGLNIARYLRGRYTDCSVTLIEKENNCGRHASGRNSGCCTVGSIMRLGV